MHQGEDLALERMRGYVYTKYGKNSRFNCATFKLNDDTFLRFLRARDFDLERAVAMLEGHLAFRDLWKPEAISSSEERVRHGLTLHGGFWRQLGPSRHGGIVQLIDLAKYDAHAFTKQNTTQDFTRLLLFQNESVMRACLSEEHAPIKTLLVFDYTHFAFSKHATPNALKLISVLADVVQNHYPEFLECGLIYNAPRAFPLFWKLIKAFLHDRMKHKLVFVSAEEGLTKYIAPELLLKKYGGTMPGEEYPNPYL